jgi:hypothetical protein
MIQDPAGLVQRIPELRPLCEDPGVLRAVERGDPFGLYRALFWARWLGRLRSHRELINALLRERRLFARPIKGSIWLGTVNGFGASLLGDSERDPHDGTHIATHCIVALFAIPLLPLGAYVVRPTEDSHALRRGWTVFARVPMGPLPWLWSRALALGVIALVLLGALNAFRDSRYQDVRLINGFSQPLRVELAGKPRTVPAHGMTVLNFVPIGRQKGRAVSESGAEVDTIELDVSSGLDVLAWNIAGAAPVYFETVVYTSGNGSPPPESKPDLYCGRQVISLSDVDYVFRDPPKSMKLSSSSSRMTRTHVDIAPLEDSGPMPLCISLLSFEKRLPAATPLLQAYARLSGWEPEATFRALRLMLSYEPSEALRLARMARQDQPDDVEMHRAYQWVAERTGARDAVLEEYRARAQSQPDSATAQYLYARLKTGHEGIAALEQLAQRYPQEPLVLRSVTYNRWRSGDWRGTIQAWESLRSLSPRDAVRIAEAEATALVALGRRGEALEQLKQLFSSADPSLRTSLAALYARVAHDQKGATPDELIVALEAEKTSESDSRLWGLRAYAGFPTEGAPDWPSLRLMSAVGHDPKVALEQAARLRIEEFQAVSHDGWALAYGEAVRTHATESETVLARAFLLDAASLDVFRRFVLGEAVSIDEAELEPSMRAAARFVRSRNATIRAEERRQLLEQARQDDWFHGTVSEAMASWAP